MKYIIIPCTVLTVLLSLDGAVDVAERLLNGRDAGSPSFLGLILLGATSGAFTLLGAWVITLMDRRAIRELLR
jgi:hypothetical protein